MKKILAFLVMALLAMPLAASAWTPDGDVTVIVAYKAGSGTDTGARLLASQAEKYVGKTLIINNLPGGDGKIGWTELVNSKPDGRTIGFINLPTFTTLAVQPGSTFAVSDVVPVCNQLSETGVVVVRANSPWKSLKELVDACKAKGTPQEIVDFYVEAFRKTMQDPACIEAHQKAGMSLDFKDNKQLAELIAAQEIFCRDVVSKLYKK